MAKQLTDPQRAWLAGHRDRSAAWLHTCLWDGFEIHHIDGDHNNNEIGTKGGANSRKNMSARQARVLARRAAKARWRPFRDDFGCAMTKLATDKFEQDAIVFSDSLDVMIKQAALVRSALLSLCVTTERSVIGRFALCEL
ncbi:MAG: hypothetical protein WAK04_12490 [Xanthobacteraceae bacterium]